MKNPFLYGLIVVLAGLLVWVTVSWDPSAQHRAIERAGISVAPKGGDFTLQSHLGPISLKELRGKVVVLYFGYTWCPDICPTSLGYLSSALNELSADELGRVQALFVSVDPERDTLDRLKTYGEYFHQNILGVTGTPQQLDQVAVRYGAAYRKVVQEKSEMGYVVDHSADLYLIDSQGVLRQSIAHGTPPEEIFKAIRGLLDNL